jgi:hypothetical protein
MISAGSRVQYVRNYGVCNGGKKERDGERERGRFRVGINV